MVSSARASCRTEAELQGLVSRESKLSARNEILNSLRVNRPEHVVLPEVRFPAAAESEADLLDRFAASLSGIGGTCVVVAGKAALRAHVSELTTGRTNVMSRVRQIKIDGSDPDDAAPAMLSQLEVAIVPSALGVAENGSVWLDEESLGHRVLSVIVESLIIVLPMDRIVSTMHDAYSQLRSDVPSFGQFVAGPSKTADIEQSLVIGAHGAKETTVIVTS